MPSGEIYVHDLDSRSLSKKEMKEVKELLKKPRKKHVGSIYCCDCPLYSLSIIKRIGCVKTIISLCGIQPKNCFDANILLNRFLKKINHNKI